jgi:hypothetical protein
MAGVGMEVIKILLEHDMMVSLLSYFGIATYKDTTRTLCQLLVRLAYLDVILSFLVCVCVFDCCGCNERD